MFLIFFCVAVSFWDYVTLNCVALQCLCYLIYFSSLKICSMDMFLACFIVCRKIILLFIFFSYKALVELDLCASCILISFSKLLEGRMTQRSFSNCKEWSFLFCMSLFFIDLKILFYFLSSVSLFYFLMNIFLLFLFIILVLLYFVTGPTNFYLA